VPSGRVRPVAQSFDFTSKNVEGVIYSLSSMVTAVHSKLRDFYKLVRMNCPLPEGHW
jgi:hypothetical protein